MRTTAPAPPRTLPAEKADDAPVTVQRHITFGMGVGDEGSHGMGEGEMAFTIDGRTFGPARDDATVRFGTTEE